MEKQNDKKFSVNFWGSHPDDNNDDCWTGSDFDTLEEAVACFAEGSDDADDAYIELTGPGVYRVKKLRDPIPETDDADGRREIAMEAGMLHGVGAYNDAMGY